jgi:hypothetical protein
MAEWLWTQELAQVLRLSLFSDTEYEQSFGTRKTLSYLARRLATAVLYFTAAILMRILSKRSTRGQLIPTPVLRRSFS